jgi:hypothetical protein
LSVSSRLAVAFATTVVAGLAAAGALAQTPTPAPDNVITPGPPPAVDNTRNDSNNSCFLNLASVGRASAEDDLTVGYVLKCATPITGYSLSVQTGAGTRVPSVTAFETEVFALAKGTNAVLPDQSFSCSGEQPGFGVNCTGYYGGAYATIPGTFDLQVPVDNLRAVPSLAVTATVFRATPTSDGKGGFKKNADGSPAIVSSVSGPYAARLNDPSIKATKPAGTKGSKGTKAKKAKAAKAKAAKAKAARSAKAKAAARV